MARYSTSCPRVPTRSADRLNRVELRRKATQRISTTTIKASLHSVAQRLQLLVSVLKPLPAV